jgi:hypothetical protein
MASCDPNAGRSEPVSPGFGEGPIIPLSSALKGTTRALGWPRGHRLHDFASNARKTPFNGLNVSWRVYV